MHYSVSLRPATHRYASRETHRHTPGEPRKSQCPGGRNSYEHLSQWAKIDSDVCPAVSAIFILPMTTHLGRSPWLCVFECVCVSMDICSNCYMHWGQLALDTSLWSSLTFTYILRIFFSGWLWEHQLPPFTDVLWQWLAGIYTIWAM